MRPCGCPPLGVSEGACNYIDPQTNLPVCTVCDCNLCAGFPDSTFLGDDTVCTCGDGIVTSPEECDDGNNVDGDGCNTQCFIESSCCFQCLTNDTLSLPISAECFNVFNGTNCSDIKIAACERIEVQRITFTQGVPCRDVSCEFCGNGIVESPEECDDGNTVDHDGCNSACVLENKCCHTTFMAIGPQCSNLTLDECNAAPSGVIVANDTACDAQPCCFVSNIGPDVNIPMDPACCVHFNGFLGLCPVCGNGILEAGEECDDNNTIGDDGCSPTCRIESLCCLQCRNQEGVAVNSDCVTTNSVSNCSGVNFGEKCFTQGQTANVTRTFGVGCNNATEFCGHCGDGIVNPGEECDDGNNGPNDGCSPQCRNESACCWQCRNAANATLISECINVVGEQACADLVFETGCPGVGAIQTFIPNVTCANASCGVCGDGTVDDSEECDDGNTVGGDGCSNNCVNETACCDEDSSGCDVREPGLCTGAERLLHPNSTVCLATQPCCFLLFTQTIQSDPVCCVALNNTLGPCPVCGNGILERGEECDDGNAEVGDGCTPTCLLEDACCFVCDNNVNISSCKSRVDGIFSPGTTCQNFGSLTCDGEGAGLAAPVTLTVNSSCEEA